MKTIAKQILFGLLALALMLSLVACGGDGDATVTTTADDTVTTTTVDQTDDATTDAEASNTKATTTEPSKSNATTKKPSGGNATQLSWAQVKAQMPANLKGSTVFFYNWNELSSITDAKKAADKFKQETGIDYKYEVGNYQTYVTEIAAMQAAKNAPDIIRMKDLNPTLMAMLQPLSKTGYDFNDKAWDQDVMDRYSYKGVAYATNMTNTLMQQPDVFFYNISLLNKFGLQDMDPYVLWQKGEWTWNKFVEVCTAFQDEAGESYHAFSPFKYQASAQLVGADFVKYTENGYVNTITDKKLIDGLNRMIKMKEAGLLTEDRWQRSAFEAGNVLFFHDAIIGARKTHFYFNGLKGKGNLGVVPLPQIDGESTYYQLYAELEAYAVPIGAKNPTAVPYFLRYWLDADNYKADQFFANKTILKVYQHCLGQKNRIMTYNSLQVLNEENGFKNFEVQIIQNSTSGLATLLGTKKNPAEAAVRQANSILDKMQK